MSRVSRQFNPPLAALAGDGLVLRVKMAEAKGQDVIANVEARTSELVHCDRVKLHSAGSRARFIKLLTEARPETRAEMVGKALPALRVLVEGALEARPADNGEAAPADLSELRRQARPVLEADDPLAAFGDAMRRLGYGGDLRTALSLEVAFTTRLLRSHRRRKDGEGRVIATLDDYETVRALFDKDFETVTTGASDAVRRVVEAVRELTTPTAGPRMDPTRLEYVTLTRVARHLGVNKSAAKKHVDKALARGWLVNRADTALARTQRATGAGFLVGGAQDLIVGEALPETVSLPTRDQLAEAEDRPILERVA